jgi:hypothetical protein
VLGVEGADHRQPALQRLDEISVADAVPVVPVRCAHTMNIAVALL